MPPSLLRFTTCGSVDDGKSTLIGRLLHDSRSVYDDHLDALRHRAARANSGAPTTIDLALLTDGLRAEREQGITIDVAYRYFSTSRRSFIIADTPGHEQYTRNMATGASTADAAIVLLDATRGVLSQSRRHAYIARLLGIPCLIAAVNKMDLMDYQESAFAAIAADFQAFAARLGWPQVYALPVSALAGDNVVSRSEAMPWFAGPPLLEYLETTPVAGAAATDGPLRFPVQTIVRGTHDGEPFRGAAGTVVSGIVHRGDCVRVRTPGARESHEARITRIVTFDGDRESAPASAAVTLAFDRELDIGRGDLLTTAEVDGQPQRARRLRAMLVWMDTSASAPGTLYWLHHSTRAVRARLTRINHRVDIDTLEHRPVSRLAINDIAEVELECRWPLDFDPYAQNRQMGAFILIDPATHATAAAGMILAGAERADTMHAVSEAERRQRWGHPALGIWVADRPEAAAHLERMLYDRLWNVVRIEAAAVAPAALTAMAQVARAAGLAAIYAGADDGDAHRDAVAGSYDTADWIDLEHSSGDGDDAVAVDRWLRQLDGHAGIGQAKEEA